MDKSKDFRGGRPRGGKRHGSRRPKHQGYESNRQIDQRIQQLESGGDPLSLAEQIAHQYDFEAKRSFDENEPSDRTNITLLQRMPLAELGEAARAEGVSEPESKSRSDLVLDVI